MAAEHLSVRAKPGVVMPRIAPHGGFCGYELVYDASESADYEIPGGPRYRLKDSPEEVPSNVYYRRALLRGDLLDASQVDDGDEPEPATESPSDADQPPPSESPSLESEV